MDDTLAKVINICRLLEERKALDVVGLDMEAQCTWTSFLLIGTANSHLHMRGLSEALRERFRELEINVAESGRRQEENTWKIIDGGGIVVSLMDKSAREYYALEERWFDASIVYNGQSSSSS